MKTKEELNALKEEVETVNKKLAELTDEELAQVSGGETACICSAGEVFFTGGIYLAHVNATGEIKPFTNLEEAEAYLGKC